MNKNIIRGLLAVFLSVLLIACGSSRKPVSRPKSQPKKVYTSPVIKKSQAPAVKKEKSQDENLKVSLPEIPREFRGAWIASVANINWPSRKDLTTEQQKAEALKLLDLLKDTHFNAVILQVRPSADALYKSEHEPWSYFLTGETGKKPSPFYDPLEFWIEEAHKRGLELHVWLNPFRAHHTNGGKVTAESMVKKSPENVVRLKNGMYWFDPASDKTQNHVSKVVKDIVRRYDIDGLHFDDYFYPYATYNQGADFPDYATWSEYQKSGGNLSRADWRRANVNKFIERIYREIKQEKNYVKFGISPFGIWKPGYPAGIKGSSQYDELYADAKLWLNQGWVDYFTPQLYWPVNSSGQNFTALLKWWQGENTKKRHLWPGLNTIEVKVADRPSEIRQQIAISRDVLKDDAGEVHWSIAGLTKSPAMVDALKNGPYKEPALIPATPWLESKPMGRPKLSVSRSGNTIQLNWETKKTGEAFLWVIYLRYGDQWEKKILSAENLQCFVPKQQDGRTLNLAAVRAADHNGNLSPYEALKVN
ncbi:family 10 glycosylhydrolase [Weeksellaceae bacterium A-14]|uniref:glycoside hydrolase family 10 protein n=1 Tax=Daejeonia sp. YH14 TaxID=3439042 RepID=UPI0031E4A9C1